MSREYLKMGDELLRKVEEQARDMILNARENVALYYYRDVHWGTQTQYIGVQIIARHDGTYNEPWNLEEDYDVLNDLVTDIVNQAKEQRFYKVDEYDDYGDFNEYEETYSEYYGYYISNE